VLMLVIMLPRVVNVWRLLPFGAEVQFAWRLLGFTGLFTALALAIWWARALPATRLTLIAAALFTLPLPFMLSDQRTVTASSVVPLTDVAIRALFSSSTVMNEYLPRQVTRPPAGPPAREAWSDDPRVTVRARRADGLHHELEIDAPDRATVVLPVFGFPGWQVRTVEGPEAATIQVREPDGLIRLVLAQPGRYRVVVFFGQTRLRGAAALVSLLALIAMYPALRWLSLLR
jgi:hypothetical protein